MHSAAMLCIMLPEAYLEQHRLPSGGGQRVVLTAEGVEAALYLCHVEANLMRLRLLRFAPTGQHVCVIKGRDTRASADYRTLPTVSRAMHDTVQLSWQCSRTTLHWHSHHGTHSCPHTYHL
jgi:hypothetical protein